MSFSDDVKEAKVTLKKIKNYDINGFARELKYWIRELHFFYNIIVPNETNDPSTSFYKIKPANRPTTGQIAYFNLRRGYPKEIYGGHYCYILKDFGSKYLVIPTTSVKENSNPPNSKIEIDIKIKDFKNDKTSRLHLSDMRAIDIQRINEQKSIYDIKEKPADLNQKISEFLFETAWQLTDKIVLLI